MKKLDDSGQMLLLAAFAIAFMIVVLTIMLNNLIYASNVASESGDELNYYEISNIVQLIDEATSAAYYNATSDGGSFNNAAFSNYMNTFQQEMAILYAHKGISFSFENSTFNDAYFTQNGLESGRDNWIVINNVKQVNNFTIEIPDTSKLANASSQFEVKAINQSGSTIWYMKLYNDSTSINVISIDQNNSIALVPYFFVDIMNNKVADTAFNFNFTSRTSNETYRIEYYNGSSAVGLYSISGNLVTNETFESERYKVINTTINIASGENKISVSVPVTVP
ncbi:hypothetical protein [Methanohalophilus sp.]|uniref:DUF7261 family protein n=1 Tax=Methanohalophilus sp. TaxID=1966352 RepID=UPI0026038D9D|nr:hypothetical protein [Methanohalophilus sp.]MDK2892705.1 hypothetical protein [Methanohalophilus sp.]